MALANAIQGAVHTPQAVTWTMDDGVPLNLTGATLTGKISSYGGEIRDIVGDLAISNALDGEFTWTYDADDVAFSGVFLVQFTATYGVDEVERTLQTTW